MGGLEVDLNSSVIDTNGNAITGFYASGELAGGIHGNNRLGINSLLDCVVFGRVVGKQAAKAKLGTSVKASRQ
jgi:succinate dehydrogenase/fumarate reductase flavoprotein subunit